jgi:hypothetical protein
MLQIHSTLAVIPPTAVGAGFSFPVPWRRAERLQAYLRRQGIKSTVHFDPAAREARLEVWPGPDAARVRAALGGWPG